MISLELIERAAAILGTDDITEEEMESQVLALAQDSMLARRLIDWIPEAFALVFIPHVARVNLPTTFSAKSGTGKWREFEFRAEPIFEPALRLGMAMYHCGPRSTFSNIVVRSCMVDAANQALNHGESLDGASLSGPALIGIPAEVYLSQSKSLWRRIFD